MKRLEKLKSMNIDELVDWLDKNIDFGVIPWIEQFDKNFCNNCESIKCHYEDSGHDVVCSWCELHDKCRYFPDLDKIPDMKMMIRMWLETEVQ